MNVEKKPFTQLLAIDPSLNLSGWAEFDLPSGRLTGAGTIKSLSAQHVLDIRLKNLQNQVADFFSEIELSESSILVCEGPAHLVLNPQSSLKVERVRAIFETLARERQALVPGRVNPRTVHGEVLGLKGKQIPRKEVKIQAVNCADKLYGKELKEIFGEKKIPQDIYDAALIGTVALGRIRFSLTDVQQMFESFGPAQFKSTQGVSTSRQAGKQASSWRNVAVNSSGLRIKE